MAEVVNGDYDVVVTCGGDQSNSMRQVAAAAAKMGIEVKYAWFLPTVNHYDQQFDLHTSLDLEYFLCADFEYSQSSSGG